MSAPKRIQRKRTKGWRMPEGAVYVGRPTKWGSDFPIGQECELDLGGARRTFIVQEAQQSVNLYRQWQVGNVLTAWARAELAGHDLACWCPLDVPCHADVLLKIANGNPS